MDLTALGTFALAAVTAWLGWQARNQIADARTARAQELAEHHRGVLRGALAEAVENCRRWIGREPRTPSVTAIALVPPPLDFDALARLLSSIDLPPDLAAYLLWVRGHVQQLVGRYLELAPPVTSDKAVDATSFNQLRGIWDQELDMLQSVVCLLRAHAASEPNLETAATSFDFRYWLTAREGPPNARMQEYELSLRPRMGAPEFPSSRPAYSQCAPSARDSEGAAAGAASKERFYRPATDAVDRLRGQVRGGHHPSAPPRAGEP